MTTTALTIRDDMPMMELGNVLAKSGYFQDARDAAQAVVKVLAGREMGFGPVASMTGINIIKGRVSLGANLIAAAVKRSGRYDYRVKAMSNDECTIEFYERVDGKREMIGVSTFTLADARKAQTQNLEKFPRNMLFARAMSNGAKWYCADVFGGPVYTPDELGAVVDGDTLEVVQEPQSQQPERPTTIIEQHKDESPKPEVKTTVTAGNGNGKKPATVKSSQYPAMLAKLGESTRYYDGTDGKINGYHVTGSAAKIGYSEITDDNIQHVFNDLLQHAQEQTTEAA